MLGVGERTIARRMAEQGEFWQSYKRGYAEVTTGLRRKQLDLALRGNATMLIWLGKQLLGQKDRHEVAGDPENPIKHALTALPTADLLAALPDALRRLGVDAAALAVALRRGE